MGISHRFSFVGFAGALMKIEITDEEREIVFNLIWETIEANSPRSGLFVPMPDPRRKEKERETYVSQLRRIMKKLGYL